MKCTNCENAKEFTGIIGHNWTICLICGAIILESDKGKKYVKAN